MADRGERGEKRGEAPSDDRPPSKQSRIDFEALSTEEHRRRITEQAEKGMYTKFHSIHLSSDEH